MALRKVTSSADVISAPVSRSNGRERFLAEANRPYEGVSSSGVQGSEFRRTGFRVVVGGLGFRMAVSVRGGWLMQVMLYDVKGLQEEFRMCRLVIFCGGKGFGFRS